MACNVINMGDHGFGIACSKGRKARNCGIPKCRKTYEALCDFPIFFKGAYKTCDMRLCARHRNRQGPDVDYCMLHQLKAQQKRNSRRKTREPRYKRLRERQLTLAL